jgi:hypothetical protein
VPRSQVSSIQKTREATLSQAFDFRNYAQERIIREMEAKLPELTGVSNGKLMTAERYVMGSIAGRVPLDTTVAAEAARFSRQFFKNQEAIEFSGDQVESFSVPNWAPKAWLPRVALKVLKFRPKTGRGRTELVATCGVSPHVDAINGPTVCLVLHNDGLTFRQGRISHKPEAGEWFIFDDAKRHAVRETAGEGVFLGLVVALESA